MSGYLGLWAEMLGIAWRRVPVAAALMLAVSAVSVVATAGLALSLRAVINASSRGEAGDALIAGVTAALCCGVSVTLQHTVWDLLQLLSDDTGIEIRHRITGWIAGIEGMTHLERTDLLDRLEDARTNSWQISMSLWQLVLALRSALQLAVMLLVLGAVSPWLLLLLPGVALPFWFDHRGKQAVVRTEQATTELFRLQRHLLQVNTQLNTGKDIRAASAGNEIARRQAAAWDHVTRLRYLARARAAGWMFCGWVIFSSGLVSALALVSYQVVQGRSTPGDVMMAVAVGSGLRQTAQQLVGRAASTLSTRTAIQSYLWIKRYAADEARVVGTIAAPTRLRTGLTFEDVTFGYPGTDQPALDQISFHVPAGNVVAVVGEYGSGKTTLVKLLAKFYQPDDGHITVDGTDLAEIDTNSWRAQMTAAFQDFGRLETSLAEGVGLGDLPHLGDVNRIEQALCDAEATAMIERLPQGLDTQLGGEAGGTDLSEGQWQRVALARSAMREHPLIFVLDEPTSSLDAMSEHIIFRSQLTRARRLAERAGAITVIVSHRFSTVAGADLILVLDRGRLVESGSHAELRALEGGRYASLYDIQADAYQI